MKQPVFHGKYPAGFSLGTCRSAMIFQALDSKNCNSMLNAFETWHWKVFLGAGKWQLKYFDFGFFYP